jgi:preprotein translocase subunit SecY
VLSAFINSFKVPGSPQKDSFTLFILAIYRLRSHVPMPGIGTKAACSLGDVAAGAVGC